MVDESKAPDLIWAWEYKDNSPWGEQKPDLGSVINGAEYVKLSAVQADPAKFGVEQGVKIVAAAICNDGLIYSLPKPARHGDVLKAMDLMGIDAMAEGYPDAQGFLTSRGGFVKRRKAAGIAIKAGQITEPQWPPHLYSEDLW